MLRIPMSNGAFFSQKVTLNGNTYELTFRYNTRSKQWKLDILDVTAGEGSALRNGITVQSGADLTGYLSFPESFGGFLFCAKLQAGDDIVTRNNLGVDKTHELLYATYAELQ